MVVRLLSSFLAHKLFAAISEQLEPETKAPSGPAPLSGIWTTPMGVLLDKIETEVREAPKPQRLRKNKPTVSAAFNALAKDPETSAEMLRFIVTNRREILQPEPNSAYKWDSKLWYGFDVMQALAKRKLPIAPEEILGWMAEMKVDSTGNGPRIKYLIALPNWPLLALFRQVEKKAQSAPLSPEARAQLAAILEWPEYGQKDPLPDLVKMRTGILALLEGDGEASAAALAYRRLSGDPFGEALENRMNALTEAEAEKWSRVFNLASLATGARPTKAFQSDADALKERLGKEWLRSHIHDWIAQACATKAGQITSRYQPIQGEVWVEEGLFTKSNVTLLKGLVWIAIGFQDGKTINAVADLCEKSMIKIPGTGPAAQATANAGLHYLEVTPGTQATARLSRMATAIKQKSVQKKVAGIVAKKAASAGLTPLQLQERSVPDYGLRLGEKTVDFDGFGLKITVDGPGSVLQTWITPEGRVQKSKPAAVTATAALKAKLTKTRAEIATLKKVLTAQRDRLDRLFAEDITWPLAEVEEHYVTHGLVAAVASPLIWALRTGGETDKAVAAIWRDAAWEDVTGAALRVDETTTAQLWHPVDWDVETVMAWRARLAALEITQPTKQAFREIYELTEAERGTQTYSNRMAAHMLKQHQAATLMAARGWRYQLMGAYDDGVDDQWAQKTFETSDLRAEFLVHTNWDSENTNEAGIYLYVGTDQLRFMRGDAAVDLGEVPARLFSEAMREADLFVGVASVGNDPAWFDQGPTPLARTYWNDYAFGSLDNFAETRRAVLETVLPRLKIRDVARLEGKFLIVEGKLNTYKIHLGSSNILMDPGDRYLCIVPAGVTKGAAIALPFAGDNRLSVILSKALMLAEDDKITANDITSQLSRGR